MTRPLAERQEAILVYLLGQAEGSGFLKYPSPPSQIAYGIGMDELPRVEGGGSSAGRGSGHRVFNPAQRIISSLTGLRQRGLVQLTRRPDGLSGSAYALTEEGVTVARTLKRERSKASITDKGTMHGGGNDGE